MFKKPLWLMTWTMKSSLFQVPGWCFHGSWFTIPPYGWVACHPLQQIIKRWNWSRKKKKANNFLERTWSQPPFGRLCFGTCSVCIMAKQIQVIVISMLFSCSHMSSSHTVSREDRCQFGPMFRSHLPRRVCPLIQTDPDPHGHGMTAGWLGRLGHTPNIWRIWHIHTS